MKPKHGGYDEGMRLTKAIRLVERSKRWNKYNRPSPYDLSSSPRALDNAKRLLRKHGINV